MTASRSPLACFTAASAGRSTPSAANGRAGLAPTRPLHAPRHSPDLETPRPGPSCNAPTRPASFGRRPQRHRLQPKRRRPPHRQETRHPQDHQWPTELCSAARATPPGQRLATRPTGLCSRAPRSGIGCRQRIGPACTKSARRAPRGQALPCHQTEQALCASPLLVAGQARGNLDHNVHTWSPSGRSRFCKRSPGQAGYSITPAGASNPSTRARWRYSSGPQVCQQTRQVQPISVMICNAGTRTCSPAESRL